MESDVNCQIPNCSHPVHGRGFCSSHYKRLRRYGDPLAGKFAKGEVSRWLVEVAIPYCADECLIWPFHRNNGGYGEISINNRMEIASRVICERVHGPAPSPQHQAAHRCGRGHEGCVNWTHLRWATAAENAEDRISHGTHPAPERPKPKLTPEAVKEIRALRGIVNTRDLARRYGVKVCAIHRINSRTTWKHV